MDNQDIAILTRVNDLAERFGLKPYDFVASFEWVEDAHSHRLRFEVPAAGNALREARFDQLLRAIGIQENGTLLAEPQEIIDALDNALQLAPRRHPRF